VIPADWVADQRPWNLKCAHAARHIERLRAACAAYRDASPPRLVPRATGDPNVTEYEFRQSTAVPDEISLILGDVLHCLRSALDNLAFALTGDALGRPMSEDEEKACQFPVSASPKKFDAFFSGTRGKITTGKVRSALRTGQPFYHLEQAAAHGVSLAPNAYEDNTKFHALHDINQLSNIDKHRRLPVSMWSPSVLLYWGSNGPTQRRWTYDPVWPWNDGDVVGRMTGPSPTPEVHQEFHLVARDRQPPRGAPTSDLPEAAQDWLMSLELTTSQVLWDYFP
jgi:hypothetical protein